MALASTGQPGKAQDRDRNILLNLVRQPAVKDLWGAREENKPAVDDIVSRLTAQFMQDHSDMQPNDLKAAIVQQRIGFLARARKEAFENLSAKQQAEEITRAKAEFAQSLKPGTGEAQ